MNIRVKTSNSYSISLGNKTIGLISFAGITILAILFIIPDYDTRWILIAALLIIVYSLQASQISYITLTEKEFIIEKIFKTKEKKDIKLFKGVREIFPFTHLMMIEFADNTKFLFWGKSEEELKRLIEASINKVVKLNSR